MNKVSAPERLVPGRLFVVSAPSGAGKTSLTRALVERLAGRGVRAEISVSYTTRAPRPGEEDGVHYHFVTDAEFERMVVAGAFLEHAQVFRHRYGTGRARTEDLVAKGTQVLLDIDWQGAAQIGERWPDPVGIFILPPSADELERRLRGRGQDSEWAIAERLSKARGEIAHHAEYDYLVVNEDFERALEELVAIVAAEQLRSARQRRRHAPLIEQLLAGQRPID